MLARRQRIPLPRPEVFRFFSDAGNLERITPPWLRFRIVTPQPIDMHPGTRIDYRIRLHGLPLRWTSEITSWEPPCRFVDEQLRGPYRLWVHEHRFEEVTGGTEVIDTVRYSVPGGRLVERWFVERDLRRIFDFRERQIDELLGRADSA